MKKLIGLVIVAFSLYSCTSTINGDGPATAQKEFTVDHINSLTVSCNCNVTIVTGNTVGVKAESHQNILDNLSVSASSGKLTIKESKDVNQYNAYDVFVYLTKDLKDLTIDKQTSLKVSGTVTTDHLTLKLKDQAKISETNIKANNLKLTANDQSNATLTGSSVALIYTGDDQSKSDLFGFETNDAQVYLTENAALNINTIKTLTGTVKDNSIVKYIGEPTKDAKVSGKAQVIKNQ